mmetsp:Transcript_71766/g.149929  ORF Transcript_71766/g.149929 Transcript_71766/m.149929 type:complete len:281 (+) Transcript_71766:362-1204(+)
MSSLSKFGSFTAAARMPPTPPPGPGPPTRTPWLWLWLWLWTRPSRALSWASRHWDVPWPTLAPPAAAPLADQGTRVFVTERPPVQVLLSSIASKISSRKWDGLDGVRAEREDVGMRPGAPVVTADMRRGGIESNLPTMPAWRALGSPAFSGAPSPPTLQHKGGPESPQRGPDSPLFQGCQVPSMFSGVEGASAALGLGTFRGLGWPNVPSPSAIGLFGEFVSEPGASSPSDILVVFPVEAMRAIVGARFSKLSASSSFARSAAQHPMEWGRPRGGGAAFG